MPNRSNAGRATIAIAPGGTTARTTRRIDGYHQPDMLPPPWLLAVGLALALIVLLPARRLRLAGLSATAITLYAVFVWALAFFLVVRPVAARFLVPILVIAFVAPFIVAPERISAIVRRTRGRRDDPPRPPMKNVTPPDERSRLR